MTTVLNLFQGKLLPSLHNALERHVPAGLTAYSPPRVSPSPLEYARYLLLAGVVVAVFYCLMKSSNLMARENQGVGGFELIDDLAQEPVLANARPASIAVLSDLDKLLHQSAGGGLGRPKDTQKKSLTCMFFSVYLKKQSPDKPRFQAGLSLKIAADFITAGLEISG